MNSECVQTDLQAVAYWVGNFPSLPGNHTPSRCLHQISLKRRVIASLCCRHHSRTKHNRTQTRILVGSPCGCGSCGDGGWSSLWNRIAAAAATEADLLDHFTATRGSGCGNVGGNSSGDGPAAAAALVLPLLARCSYEPFTSRQKILSRSYRHSAPPTL